jgi:hypothetical protein
MLTTVLEWYNRYIPEYQLREGLRSLKVVQ